MWWVVDVDVDEEMLASSSQTGKREPMKAMPTRGSCVVALQPVEHIDRRHPGKDSVSI